MSEEASDANAIDESENEPSESPYNSLDITDDTVTIRANDADFSDTSVVSKQNRPAVLMAHLRTLAQEQEAPGFDHQFIRNAACYLFGISEESADAYPHKLVAQQALYPQISADPLLINSDRVADLRQDIVSYFLATNDAAICQVGELYERRG